MFVVENGINRPYELTILNGWMDEMMAQERTEDDRLGESVVVGWMMIEQRTAN